MSLRFPVQQGWAPGDPCAPGPPQPEGSSSRPPRSPATRQRSRQLLPGPGPRMAPGAQARLGSRCQRSGGGWQPGPPLAPAFRALPEAGGGPASGRSPRRSAARGGARGLSPGAGGFWERPAQGGGLAAARAAVRAARRARRARSEGAAPGGAHSGTRGGRRGPRRACGAAARPGLCLPGTCLALALSWQQRCR